MSADTVPKALADQMYEALRLTREYVGADLLPAVKGWSWYDAMTAYEDYHDPELNDGTGASK